MVKFLKKKDNASMFRRLVNSFFQMQKHFTHIVEVENPRVEPCLYAMWHGDQCAIFGLQDKGRTNILISRSRDGDIIAHGVENLGFKLIRGSKGKKGAVEATMQMIEVLKAGECAAMMVDGPKGPVKVAKDGAIKIAKLAGVPIVPMCWYSTNFNWVKFPSWDSLHVPIFDVRLINLYGEPIYVPADADEAQEEEARQKLQASLNELEKRAPEVYKKVYAFGLWRKKQ